MGNPTILIGLAIVLFTFVYMFFKLGEQARENSKTGTKGNHFLLQLLILFLILSSLTLVAKVVVDDKDFCSWNVVNSTTVGATTSFGYDYQCQTNPSSVPITFYKMSLWFFRIVAFYIFVYYFYAVMQSFDVGFKSK
jgi:hypothetical protein